VTGKAINQGGIEGRT
jgi:glutamate dehydrogenase (NAD(P)+)